MSGERRRGIVCLHTRLTTAHDHCPDCGTSVTNVIVWTDQYAAARAWVGLAMWCMCGGRFDE